VDGKTGWQRKRPNVKGSTVASKPNHWRRPAAAIKKTSPPAQSTNKNTGDTNKKHEATSHTRRVTKTVTRRVIRRRTNKFSNVASSGYGSSSYQPIKQPIKQPINVEVA